MGLEIGTVLGIASLVVGAAGTGLAYYSSQQAASQQQRMALLNMRAQQDAANMQARIQQAQAQFEAAQAELLARQQQTEAAAKNAYAASVRTEADNRARANQENIERSRRDAEKLKAMQLSALAKNGIVDTTGSPLDLLAETADAAHQAAAEAGLETEAERRSLFHEAASAEFDAGMLGINANMSRLQAARNQASGVAALAAGRLNARQAQIEGLGAVATARGARTSATAGLVQSLAGLAGTGYDYYRQGAFRFSKT